MKTEKEIRKQLKAILEDERLSYKPADVQINAPLVLIRVNLEAKRAILKWVLEED